MVFYGAQANSINMDEIADCLSACGDVDIQLQMF